MNQELSKGTEAAPIGRAVDPGAVQTRSSILLIEDDRHIANLVITELKEAGYEVLWSLDGPTGLERFRQAPIHLVVLDLNLPGMDGLTVCERIRAQDIVTPILMLTARSSRKDIILGLESGADEYVTKPFDTPEFIARVRALFRRHHASSAFGREEKAHGTVHCGPLIIDPISRTALLRQLPITLTAKEFDLLLLFARHPGRTFSRDELLTRAWGPGFEGFEHTVNTHINRLRSKVEPDPRNPQLIETVWGVGYRLASPLPDEA